jgi:hypothetical protein
MALIIVSCHMRTVKRQNLKRQTRPIFKISPGSSTPRSLHNPIKMKAQSRRARVTLFRESPHNHRRVGSSGWNLACKGLLLGMWPRGHRDPHTRKHHRMWTPVHILSSTHPHILCRAELVVQRSSNPDRVESSLDRGRGLSPLREFAPEETSGAKATSH